MKMTLCILIALILFSFPINKSTGRQIDKGERLAKQCLNCHLKSLNNKQSGLTNIRKVKTFDWIYNFTKNPLQFSKRDIAAKKIIEKYKPTIMGPFPLLTKAELKLILDFYDRK